MALALDRRHRLRLIVAGAILGALIGPLGLWLDVRPKVSPQTRQEYGTVSEVVGRWATGVWSLEGGWTGLIILAVPFAATLVLMPKFIRWLETRLDRDTGVFYLQASLGGVVLGAVATSLIAWGLLIAAVIAGTTGSTANLEAGEAGAAVVGGTLVFGPLMGLFAPLFFIPSIVGLGIPFGLLFGALVRRLARDESAHQ